MNTTKIKSLLRTKTSSRVAISIGIASVSLMIFYTGVEYGYHNAEFISRSGDNYYGIFTPREGRPDGVARSLSDSPKSTHGVSGKIVSISLPTMIVADKENIEKTVRIDDDTALREFHNTILSSDLKAGDDVVILGSPGPNTEISARLIRVLPTPPIPPQSQYSNSSGFPSPAVINLISQ